MTVFTWVS